MIKLNFQRQEFKYLLSPDQYQQVSRYFQRRGLCLDPYSVHQPDKSYYIASLYLDTPDYQGYWEKMYGLEHRTKYRLRTYFHTGAKTTPVFWEIKHKFSNFLKKDRFRLPWPTTQRFLNSEFNLDGFIRQTDQPEIATKFYFNWLQKNLRPSVLISYEREAWLDPFYPGFRLTFDRQIQAVPTPDLFCPHRQTAVLPGQIIMEIKFTGPLPTYLAQICQYFNFSREAVSKYCLAMEACGIVSEENILNKQ